MHFSCSRTTTQTAGQIAERILDTDRWPSFDGWGPLPGIQRAEFRLRTDQVVGSQIAVENRDGSRHLETISVWQPNRIELTFSEFGPPVVWLADGFVESWQFQDTPQGTLVTRTLRINPRHWLAYPPLLAIAWMLKQALTRHLDQICR